MLTVENKVIAIAGASSGIGEATAHLLAQKGLRVVLGARRTDRLEAIARAIAFAIEQPADVDVNEIVVRPIAQIS
jgi:NADP-dependent 3-hydroxy acid dehydrogenase YdfG